MILFQAQNRAAYYSANQLAQLRPSPRWATQGVRPQRKCLLIYSSDFLCVVSNLSKNTYHNPLLVSVFSDFQNMPNAMRPSAPRPQTFNTIRATTTTNTQVPRMMASQRMRKSQSHLLCRLVTTSINVWVNCCFSNVDFSHTGA